ncbi:C45 family autoproteolytic acyltransferase/hydolase [Aidingimonas halophila]|uniref:Isopenicillin-N N-acyltransferase like protein n=1 Tax=Aidingimonas halophila TaxID=574349 RepID=A0A1H3FLX3_9GAMM|nr:C45 family peptidase [Aidingimonas halophila]GHC38147.1 peptidase C45 [Aidingimonas halophila]SDX92093.1 isopenicillin-N N-acyltransferase like protein [Aidingimonas halophila]
MQLTELHGDRHTIGEIHGSMHADRIHHGMAVYDRLFHDFVGLDWQTARHQARRFLPAIERHFPAILDEIEGLARGAGVDADDILTLNCRSEISLTQAGGCSAFSLFHHDQWLAQNWDWRADQQHNVVALRITVEGIPTLVSLGEAGMLAKIGLNEAGVGVGLNAIRSRTCGAGLPIHIALRKMLESPDFATAKRVATHDRVASPAHILLAGAGGDAVGLEVHPGLPGELAPDDGVVTHTNHLCTPSGPADFPRPDSYTRLERLRKRLGEIPARGEFTADALFDVLSDHDNAPMAVCRHHNPAQPEAERMETLFAVAMNLDRRELHVRLGKPCEPISVLRVSL